MSSFEDLPREVRHMIYTYAMRSDHVLVEKHQPNKRLRQLKLPFPLPLLTVGKNVSQEAIGIFYTINTFQILHHLLPLEKPLVFTKYAALFRSVKLEFDERWEWESERLIEVWKKQIRELSLMSNLRWLSLGIDNLKHNFYRKGIGWIQRTIIDHLKPELLASLLLGNGKEQRSCITISISAGFWEIDNPDLRLIQEAWEGPGINVVTTIGS